MKAFYIDSPAKHAVREIEQPQLAIGQVLLKTRLIGFCGTDLSTFRGLNPLVSYPRIPGHEVAATIVETSSGVPPELHAGVNVAVYPNTHCGRCASCVRGRTNACKFNETMGVQRDGALCEWFVAPWEKLYRADALSLRELSLVEPLGVGFHAASRGRVQAGDRVAVVGCGMVGLGAVAAACERDATVITIDLEDDKLALSRRVGAHHIINSRTESVHDRLLELTDGLGPDVVIEAVGTPQTYTLAVEEVAHTGRVVYVGWSKQPITFETKFFVHKELDILGARNSLREFPEVIAMLSRHTFPVEETISRTVPLEAAGKALEEWASAPQKFTKILVEVNA